MLTVYDFPSAAMVDDLELDLALVGDSLGEVVYGLPNTQYVTMDLMARHVEAVARGMKQTHIVGDMPFASYGEENAALTHAQRLIDSGAHSVKLENPSDAVVRKLAAHGIPVMGHVGLTPQSILDYKKQGKDPESARRITEDALRLQNAGCFAVVIEAVPDALAGNISRGLTIPIIGIAAGAEVDGQVLVWHDLFGFDAKKRSYSPKMADVRGQIRRAATDWFFAVREGRFPSGQS